MWGFFLIWDIQIKYLLIPTELQFNFQREIKSECFPWTENKPCSCTSSQHLEFPPASVNKDFSFQYSPLHQGDPSSLSLSVGKRKKTKKVWTFRIINLRGEKKITKPRNAVLTINFMGSRFIAGLGYMQDTRLHHSATHQTPLKTLEEKGKGSQHCCFHTAMWLKGSV